MGQVQSSQQLMGLAAVRQQQSSLLIVLLQRRRAQRVRLVMTHRQQLLLRVRQL
jgi:hypothetical protein